jgi:hypothetical protein
VVRQRPSEEPSPGPTRPARRGIPVLRTLAALVLLLYPIAAGTLLLTSDGWAVNRLNVRLWYAVTGAVGLREQISPEAFAAGANVVLFVPFFAALAVLVPTWWWVLAGAALSTAIELYQGVLGTREQDLVDIVANTAGAALGVGLGLVLRRLIGRSPASEPPAAPRRPDLSGAGAAPTAPTTPGAALDGSERGRDGGPDDRG